jgi:hypothetical protein
MKIYKLFYLFIMFGEPNSALSVNPYSVPDEDEAFGHDHMGEDDRNDDNRSADSNQADAM